MKYIMYQAMDRQQQYCYSWWSTGEVTRTRCAYASDVRGWIEIRQSVDELVTPSIAHNEVLFMPHTPLCTQDVKQ